MKKKRRWIGLKDKNGTKIYEGDKLFNPWDKEPYYIMQWNIQNNCWSLGDSGFPLTRFRLDTFWEVIGNIYEEGK